jgi:hypothetical protein
MKNLLFLFSIWFTNTSFCQNHQPVIVRYNKFADYFDKYLFEGIDYTSIERKYKEQVALVGVNESTKLIELDEARKAEISIVRARSWNSAKESRRQGLAKLQAIQGSQKLADDEIWRIVDTFYHKNIPELSSNYLSIVKANIKGN